MKRNKGKRVCLAVILLLFLLKTNAFAQENTNENTNPNVPVIDTNQTLTITVDLEDEKRFMGIEVYQICTYDGTKFTYNTLLQQFAATDYSNKVKASERYEDINEFIKYMEKHPQIEPIATIDLVKGSGSMDGLPLGVYIIMQGKADYNAKLSTYTLVEGPTLSKDGMEYLYDIHIYPKWDRAVWFAFRPEVVEPLKTVILLLIALLTAFLGAKLLNSLFYSFCFVAFGLLGYYIALPLISDYIWLMVIFIIAAFVGIGGLWFVFSISQGTLIRLKIKNIFSGHLFWITPVVAFVLSSIVIRNNITKNPIISMVIPLIIAIVGGIYQFIKRKDIRVFHTYDDLISMEINGGDTENAGC